MELKFTPQGLACLLNGDKTKTLKIRPLRVSELIQKGLEKLRVSGDTRLWPVGGAGGGGAPLKISGSRTHASRDFRSRPLVE